MFSIGDLIYKIAFRVSPVSGLVSFNIIKKYGENYDFLCHVSTGSLGGGGDDTYFILSVAFAVIIQHQTRADDLFLIYFNTLSTRKQISVKIELKKSQFPK